MRRWLVTAVLAMATSAHADECRFSAEDMSADLAQLEQSVANDWAFGGFRRVEVSAAFATARTALPASANGAAFREILERIVSRMRDGHGFAYVPCEDRLQLRRWPFAVVDTADGVIVDEPDGAALACGDRLVAVDGIPIEKLIEHAELRAPGATLQYRRWRALEELRMTTAQELKVSVIDERNHRRSLQVATVPWRWSPSETIETRDLGNGVSYLRISSFMAVEAQRWLQATAAQRKELLVPARKRIDEAFKTVAASHALVLDLRGNQGGIAELGQEVADHLLAPGYVYYAARTANGFLSLLRPPASGVERYDGRVVVLIDERTASAAEVLGYCLRDSRTDIVFVGRRTAGAGGAPGDVTLQKSGAKVSFSTVGLFGPKGDLIEGHGVEPNIVRGKRRLDLARSIDVDLAAALDLLGWKPPR